MRRILPALWLCFGSTVLFAEEGAPAKRLSVAVLGFENKTGDPELGHWRHALDVLLSEQLWKAKALRQKSGMAFAFRQLGFKSASPLDAAQAKKMGEIIEAQRVVWGSYQREGEKWQVTVRLLNVVTGKVSADLTVAAADWWEVRDGVTEEICKELAVEPSGEERRQMEKRWTKSPLALEAMSKALSAQNNDEPLMEQERHARGAVLADPACPKAHAWLAAILGSQGNLVEAEVEARSALKIDANDAGSRLLMGHLLMEKGNSVEAEKELREALRIYPDDAESLTLLGQLCTQNKNWDEASKLWEKARLLDPLDATLHALLGQAYAIRGDSEKAEAALEEAERLNLGSINEEQQLFDALGMQGKAQHALEHFEKFAALVRKNALNPAALKMYEEKAERLRKKFSCVAVEAPMPRIYTPEGLEAVLHEKLSEDRLKLVKNSLVSGPDLKSWAMRVTRDASTDTEKAKALLCALSHRPEREGKSPSGTALEAFAAWDKADEALVCDHFAKLFVAMARDIGLKAFYTIVEKDYQGRRMYHACGAVFLDGKAFLVDPTFHWFGVPHQEFQILDDLQTLASDLYGAGEPERYLECCLVASELFPQLAVGQVSLVHALMRASKWKEARQVLEYVSNLWPDRWDVFLTQGLLESRDEKPDDAVKCFRKSIDLNPRSTPGHFYLAEALRMKGKLDEALAEYQESLRYTDPEFDAKSAAQRAILQLDEQLMAAASSSVKPN